ncbi:helix-turn-helix domain-containing protein [Pseudonocardia humida]|uniref:helix-turn-helix domain-containing protein n=1 Tax=Pseudonocardia humida TaxID=2800819 RepID=UPI00207C71CF|nr:helix-turn-helix domain-containing protein [Pseudonocardia humida]
MTAVIGGAIGGVAGGVAGGVTGGTAGRIAANRERQRELYGAPLGDRVRALTAALRVSQARLAKALGLSPAMLSQLASARRVKIGDPAVLARLLLLDQRCRALPERPGARAVEALLAEVAAARWHWSGGAPSPGPGRPLRRVAPRTPSAADALRTVAEPARLAAAAAALGTAFPELAEVLRQAAARPRAAGRPGPGSRRRGGVSSTPPPGTSR